METKTALDLLKKLEMKDNMKDNTGFVIGEPYNWKNQPERLVYLGVKYYPDGPWHQFAKVEAPNVVWSEVRDYELQNFEKTA